MINLGFPPPSAAPSSFDSRVDPPSDGQHWPLPPQNPLALSRRHEEPKPPQTFRYARPAPRPEIKPPRWAVPARGEARLEPVCEAVGTHPFVDLTTRPYFRIGRSPDSDVRLLHSTSSRRHAIVFHHPNGSCYIVDCGSAHGTYVGGVRVKSMLVTKENGVFHKMVVPHRVRRGALIRFGGPGAPSFVLKSFSVGFNAIASVAEALLGDDDDEVKGETQEEENIPPLSANFLETLPPSSAMEPKPVEQPQPQQKTVEAAALVLFNTRINALGPSAAKALRPSSRRLAQRVADHFFANVSTGKRRSRDPSYTNGGGDYGRDAKRSRKEQLPEQSPASTTQESSPMASSPVPVSPNTSPTSSPVPRTMRGQAILPPPPSSLSVPSLVPPDESGERTRRVTFRDDVAETAPRKGRYLSLRPKRDIILARSFSPPLPNTPRHLAQPSLVANPCGRT